MKDKAKNSFLKVRINTDNKETLEQIAASQGLSLSAYTRAKLMDDDFTSIRSDIPNLIDIFRVLNTLCYEIDKSNNKHLIALKKGLMKSLINHKERKVK